MFVLSSLGRRKLNLVITASHSLKIDILFKDIESSFKQPVRNRRVEGTPIQSDCGHLELFNVSVEQVIQSWQSTFTEVKSRLIRSVSFESFIDITSENSFKDDCFKRLNPDRSNFDIINGRKMATKSQLNWRLVDWIDILQTMKHVSSHQESLFLDLTFFIPRKGKTS